MSLRTCADRDHCKRYLSSPCSLSQRIVILGLCRSLKHVPRKFLACGEPDDVFMRLAVADDLFKGVRHVGSAAEFSVNERVDTARLAALRLFGDEVETILETLHRRGAVARASH
jgi:hypothetical protein